MTYWITWIITILLRPLFFPLKVYGRENIPKKGSFILASNHRSHLDPMVIPICINRRISFMAKDSLLKGKFLGWLLPRLEVYPIKRESSDFGALRGVLNRLKRGLPVLIFPEGTRVVDDSERKIQQGIGLIAQKSRVPIVPVYVSGTNEAFPPKSRRINRVPVSVTFGKPINPSSDLSRQDVADDIMKKILSIPTQQK